VEASPVLFVHGFASSAEHNWRQPGWLDLLAEAGRETVAVDLLGHGRAPRPVAPADYGSVESRVAAEIAGYDLVDAVGFSAGAHVLLRLAAQDHVLAVTLHHIIRPTPDGDTLYADLGGAYDRLHPRDRARFGTMKTIAQVPSVAHPLVRKHPVTGRTILYVNLEPTARIVDEEGKEHPDLVPFLREHLNRGCYRHKWHAGDLVVVDNFAAAHCATLANPKALRVLHRTTVPGPRVWWQEAIREASRRAPSRS